MESTGYNVALFFLFFTFLNCDSKRIDSIYYPASTIGSLKNVLFFDGDNAKYINDSLFHLRVNGELDEIAPVQSVTLELDTLYFFKSTYFASSYCFSKRQKRWIKIPGSIESINPLIHVNNRILLNVITNASALSIGCVLSNYYVLSESFDVENETHFPIEFQSCIGKECPALDFYCTDIKYKINADLPGEVTFTLVDLMNGPSYAGLKINDSRLPAEIREMFDEYSVPLKR